MDCIFIRECRVCEKCLSLLVYRYSLFRSCSVSLSLCCVCVVVAVVCLFVCNVYMAWQNCSFCLFVCVVFVFFVCIPFIQRPNVLHWVLSAMLAIVLSRALALCEREKGEMMLCSYMYSFIRSSFSFLHTFTEQMGKQRRQSI